MPRFDLVAFDLYGTLLDVSGLAARLVPIVGDRAPLLLAAWRRAQLERTWELNRRGEYAPWDEVTLHALAQVAPELDPARREQVARIWDTVPPHPDAALTLAELRKAKVRTAVLSNGTQPMIRSALRAAAISVDEVRSADDVRVYKTDPRVYALLDPLARRERTLFVSSNGWDAEGAKRDGRTVAFVDRGGQGPGLAPDFVVHALADLLGVVAVR